MIELTSNQDFGDEFGDEEFESGGAVDIMDEAEKQFEESNRDFINRTEC